MFPDAPGMFPEDKEPSNHIQSFEISGFDSWSVAKLKCQNMSPKLA